MTELDLQPFIDWLSIHPSWILFSVFAISFVESLALAGIVVPGVVLIYVVATLCGHLGIPVWHVLSCGFFGALAGDGISFFLGYYYKDSLRGLWPFSRYPKALELGETFFIRHGGKSIMLGRFVGPIRPVLPLVAGMMGMRQSRFTLYNVLSALAWAPVYILPGYLVGTAYERGMPGNLIPILIILALVVSSVFLTIRYVSNRATLNNTPPSKLSLNIFFFSIISFSLGSALTLNTTLFNSINSLVFEFATNIRGGAIDPILVTLTLLGDEGFLYVSFTLVAVFLWTLKKKKFTYELILAGLSTAAITHSLKFGFAVPRPELVLNPPSSFAFPSGHSSGATVFYILIAYLVAQSVSESHRWKCYAGFSIPILCIALSRVLLGVHWLTDIIGGILLGLSIVSLTHFIFTHYRLRDENDQAINRSYTFGLGMVWCFAFCAYHYNFFTDTLTRFSIMS